MPSRVPYAGLTMKKSKRNVSLPQQTREAIARQVSGEDGKPQKGLQGAVMRVLGVQRPLVLAYVKRLRRKHPEASAAQLAVIAERDYLRTVTGTGAAGGATAVVPGMGTVASLGVSAGVTVAFLEASALYAQAVAELHGVAVDDPDQAKALVMAVMLGDEGASLLAGMSDQLVAGPKGPAGWGAVFATAGGKGGAWSSIGKELQGRFLRHFAASQTAGALGRALPFGIGAAVGGVSSRVLGNRVVRSTKLAFGSLSTLSPLAIDAKIAAGSGAALEAAALSEELRAHEEVSAAVEAERERRTLGGTRG